MINYYNSVSIIAKYLFLLHFQSATRRQSTCLPLANDWEFGIRIRNGNSMQIPLAINHTKRRSITLIISVSVLNSIVRLHFLPHLVYYLHPHNNHPPTSRNRYAIPIPFIIMLLYYSYKIPAKEDVPHILI